jgi:uncharacterized UBP type Zn finger protein
MTCTHLDQITDVAAQSTGCEKCLQMGDRWVSLRKCLVCGHVGCCDSSVNQHATKHFHETGHPIIQPLESDPKWMWCYIDEEMLAPPNSGPRIAKL